MTPQDIAVLVASLTGAFPSFTPSALTPDMYLVVLEDLDAQQVNAALLEICRRGGQWAPSAGDIRVEVERLYAPAGPPSMDAALGYYVSGRWDIHPLVEAAAKQVYWDRNNAPDKAQFDFRRLYAAALEDDDLGTRRRKRDELTGPKRIMPELGA